MEGYFMPISGGMAFSYPISEVLEITKGLFSARPPESVLCIAVKDFLCFTRILWDDLHGTQKSPQTP
jgi:hypothetical protein